CVNHDVARSSRRPRSGLPGTSPPRPSGLTLSGVVIIVFICNKGAPSGLGTRGAGLSCQNGRDMTLRRAAAAGAAVAAVSLLAAACSASSANSTATAKTGIVVAVGAENQYANVISQIGGRYVRVTAIESNPNTDPHTFEASASVSQVVGAAELAVQNGLGYDSFMTTIENGSPNPVR